MSLEQLVENADLGVGAMSNHVPRQAARWYLSEGQELAHFRRSPEMA